MKHGCILTERHVSLNMTQTLCVQPQAPNSALFYTQWTFSMYFKIAVKTLALVAKINTAT